MKVAVITGAANGIGLALSQVCLQRGMHVVMLDKDDIKLQLEVEALAQKYPDSITPIPCDITQADEIKQVLNHIDLNLRRIDWVFNNAGIMGHLAPVWDLEPSQIHQVMEVNLYGMIHLIREFMPYLFNQSFRSHIINIASLYSLCAGSHLAAYSMSKHAVLALSESLYFDLDRLQKPVDISVVLPSFTDTSLLSTKPHGTESGFHSSLNSLLAHSRPAMDTALHIIQEIEKKRFYIMPDKEVKGYCEDRTNAIINQEFPNMNSIEKLIRSLMKRKMPGA